MSAVKHKERIDTSIDGQVIHIFHNLDDLTPEASLFEVVNLADYKAVSLYDSRIVAIESRGKNETLISFASPFNGMIQFSSIKNEKQSLTSRVEALEEAVKALRNRQDYYLSKTQWEQSLVIIESENQKLQSEVNSIEEEIEKLKKTIDSL